MADALLSPAVGGTLWVAAAGAVVWSSRKVGRDLEDRAIPLMGVLGAFLFAVQMINFTIPGTGASGHLGGGLLLAILLGPAAAFLTIASILLVQALLFADGGLLALGCNLFNLGLLPCFAGYPVFRRLAGEAPGSGRLFLATMVTAMFVVQLGALAVVLETVSSGIAELPFRGFASMLLPIHLGIGIVEGIATALIARFLRRARPEIWTAAAGRSAAAGIGGAVSALAAAVLLTAGVLTWFASDRPDGLEWSILRVAGTAELPARAGRIYAQLADLQAGTAILPEYDFRSASPGERGDETDVGSSLAGLVGGTATLLLTAGIFWLLRQRQGDRT